jgi:hypothetical protein
MNKKREEQKYEDGMQNLHGGSPYQHRGSPMRPNSGMEVSREAMMLRSIDNESSMR